MIRPLRPVLLLTAALALLLVNGPVRSETATVKGGATSGSSKAARPSACKSKDFKQARARAKPLFARKDYAGAAQLLDAVIADCHPVMNPDAPDPDYLWLQSDRAFAALRAGDPTRCLRVVAEVPIRPDIVDVPAYDAVMHNKGLCEKALEQAQPSPAAATACALPAKHESQSSAALPSDMVPGAADAACLLLTPGDRPKYAELQLDAVNHVSEICPQVVLVVKARGGGALQERVLRPQGGPLATAESCCNLQQIAVGVRGGKRVVRVVGEGRDCFGGDATDRQDSLYEWQGDELKLLENHFVNLR